MANVLVVCDRFRNNDVEIYNIIISESDLITLKLCHGIYQGVNDDDTYEKGLMEWLSKYLEAHQDKRIYRRSEDGVIKSPMIATCFLICSGVY